MDEEPRWSHDGRRIAFSAIKGGLLDLPELCKSLALKRPTVANFIVSKNGVFSIDRSTSSCWAGVRADRRVCPRNFRRTSAGKRFSPAVNTPCLSFAKVVSALSMK